MSTDEDYLDQLLHAVTENYREEQGITGEPEPEVGEKFVSNPEAVLTSEPLVEHIPESEPVPESIPEPEMVYEPVNEQEPGSEQTPDFDALNQGEMPADMPLENFSIGEMPADMPLENFSTGEMPADMPLENFSTGEVPADMPMEEVPVDMPMDMPVGEMPVDEYPSAMEALGDVIQTNEGGEPFFEENMMDMPMEENPMDMPMEENPMDIPMEENPMDMPMEENPMDMPMEEVPMDMPMEEFPMEEAAPVEEAPAFEMSDDPNHIMTPEEIAALVGGGQAPSPDEAPADEPLMEDMPMEEIPMDMPMEEVPMDMPLDEMPAEEIPMDVPLEEMSAEDIPMEDEVPAAEPSDDPNHMMTPEEIAAMIESAEEAATEGSDMDEAAMAETAEEPLPDIAEEPTADETAEPSEEPLSDIPEEPAKDSPAEDVIPIDFGLEGGDIPLDAETPEPVEMPAGDEEPSTSDILGDLGLAGAESSDLDVTDIINDMPADDELNEINDLLIKNDNSEMVEDDLLSMLDGSADADGESADEEIKDRADGGGEEASDDDTSSKKKKRKRKEKKKKGDEEPQLDAEGNPVKKKGLLTRITEFLFAGDDEDDEGSEASVEAVAQDGTLVANPSEQTLENNEVIREVENEEE